MDFKVNFRAVGIAGSSTRSEKEYDIINKNFASEDNVIIGTDLLKKLNLSANQVNNTKITGYNNNIQIIITQAEAEETKLFGNENEIYVNVSFDILKTYFDIVLNSFDNLVFIPHTERIIQFWKDNNYNTLILTDKDQIKLEQREQNRIEVENIKRQEEENKIKRNQEKEDWIKNHGSQYLKDCLELGQFALKEYVTERAVFEFPDFELDFNDEMKWDDRYSPSQEALNELKKIRMNYPELESDIVRLKEYEDDGWYYFEAVVIRKYLGKYDLVKKLDEIESTED